MSEDALPELAGTVRGLAARPLAEHPDVLEHVHQELASELQTAGRVPDPPGRS